MDTVSPEKRSWMMSRIKGRNTRPEKIVRSILHALGYRFRLQRKDFPGKPDIVLPKYRAVIFVHGCFWHRHDCKVGNRLPKSNIDYWLPKLARNQARDMKHREALEKSGWKVLVLWECMTRDQEALASALKIFLHGNSE